VDTTWPAAIAILSEGCLGDRLWSPSISRQHRLLLCCVMTWIRTVIAGAGARWVLGIGAGVAAALALLADDSVSAGVEIGLTVVLALLLLLSQVRPVVEVNGDSVAAFAGDFKERLLSGRYRTVTAFADNYPLTGVSRSTAYSAISGVRLPTAATTKQAAEHRGRR